MECLLITASALSCGSSMCVCWCVCAVRGPAPSLYSFRMLSNHTDHRGSCLRHAVARPCEGPAGPYRETAGAHECHVGLYEHVSE